MTLFRDWFVVNYLSHVSAAIRGHALHIPVTEVLGGDVKYYLEFLTLRHEGFSSFLNTTSGAFQEWRRFLHDHVEGVFDEEDIEHWGISDDDIAREFEEDEQQLEAQWISFIEDNITIVLANRSRFEIYQEYQSVLDDLLGYARAKHIRAAWHAQTTKTVSLVSIRLRMAIWERDSLVHRSCESNIGMVPPAEHQQTYYAALNRESQPA